MVRVLHVVSKMDAGGMETFIMNVYRKIDKSQVQFDFLVHNRKKGFYDDEIEKLGGHIYRLSFREDNNFFKYIKDLNIFFDVHKEYHTVHGHLASLACFYMCVAKKHGVKNRIVHSHGASHETNLKGWVKNFLYKFAWKYSTERFACSESSGKYLFGKHGYKIILNPIDCNRFRYIPSVRNQLRIKMNCQNNIVFGCIARLDQQKNHTYLLDIFNEYCKLHRDAFLWIIGIGPLEKEIKRKAKKLGIEQKVLFLGIKSDVEKYYQAMDVFIMPSNYEGLAVVTIEAQCSGLPTIVSDRNPPEANVTDNIVYISLKQPPAVWVNLIDNKLKGFVRTDCHEAVIDSGYDSSAVSAQLCTLYKEMEK